MNFLIEENDAKKIAKMIEDICKEYRKIFQCDGEIVFSNGETFLYNPENFPSLVRITFKETEFPTNKKLTKAQSEKQRIETLFKSLTFNVDIKKFSEFFKIHKKDVNLIEIDEDSIRFYINEDLVFINKNKEIEINPMYIENYENQFSFNSEDFEFDIVSSLLNNPNFSNRIFLNLDEMKVQNELDLDNVENYFEFMINKKFLIDIKETSKEKSVINNISLYLTELSESNDIYLITVEIEKSNYKYLNYYIVIDIE